MKGRVGTFVKHSWRLLDGDFASYSVSRGSVPRCPGEISEGQTANAALAAAIMPGAFPWVLLRKPSPKVAGIGRSLRSRPVFRD